MNIVKFFELLYEFYGEVPDTNYCVKFYAQAGTFSFEIHDRDETCFTPDSLVSSSEVYYSWMTDSEVMEEIIHDILKEISDARSRKIVRKVFEK